MSTDVTRDTEAAPPDSGPINGVAVAHRSREPRPERSGSRQGQLSLAQPAGRVVLGAARDANDGKKFGTFFLPEVGDEVLVAFERGDIRFPYVVGSLWNGDQQATDDQRRWA